MSEFSYNIGQLRASYNTKRAMLEERVNTSHNGLQSLQEESVRLAKVSEALSRLCELATRDSLDKLEVLISYALQTIMDDDTYRFSIKPRELKTGVVYEFFYSKQGMPEFPLTNPGGNAVGDTSGGGVKDIVSVMLSIIIPVILDPSSRRFAALDERFKHLSHRYLARVVEVIDFMKAKLGYQFLLITQREELLQAADKAYRVSMVNKETVFTEISAKG